MTQWHRTDSSIVGLPQRNQWGPLTRWPSANTASQRGRQQVRVVPPLWLAVLADSHLVRGPHWFLCGRPTYTALTCCVGWRSSGQGPPLIPWGEAHSLMKCKRGTDFYLLTLAYRTFFIWLIFPFFKQKIFPRFTMSYSKHVQSLWFQEISSVTWKLIQMKKRAVSTQGNAKNLKVSFQWIFRKPLFGTWLGW